MTQRFVIFDVERTFDEKVCHSEQDVRATISGADLSHFTVVEFDTDEGRCRDVSDLFIADEAEEPEQDAYDRAASAADRRYQFERETV